MIRYMLYLNDIVILVWIIFFIKRNHFIFLINIKIKVMTCEINIIVKIIIIDSTTIKDENCKIDIH
jgi:hypothetical protein